MQHDCPSDSRLRVKYPKDLQNYSPRFALKYIRITMLHFEMFQLGHNNYQDPMRVLDSDNELLLLNGDPTDYYMFDTLTDISNCTGNYNIILLHMLRITTRMRSEQLVVVLPSKETNILMAKLYFIYILLPSLVCLATLF